MIELHGWITIRETYKSFFEEEEQIDSVTQTSHIKNAFCALINQYFNS